MKKIIAPIDVGKAALARIQALELVVVEPMALDSAVALQGA
jgi:hypothetical protein